MVLAIAIEGDASAGVWLDSTFGSDGKAVVDLGSNSADEAQAIARDDAGNIYVAGTSDASAHRPFCVVKLDPDGTLDSAFGDAGVALVDLPTGFFHSVRGVAIASDGSVFVGGSDNLSGSSDMSVIKFTPAGRLDTSWGNAGRVLIDTSEGEHEYLSAMLLADDGRLFLAGSTYLFDSGYVFEIVALDDSGSPDASFGDGGVALVAFDGASASANAILRDPAGNLFVGGYVETAAGDDMALVKLDASGRLVRAFGIDGEAIVDAAHIDIIVAMTRDAAGNFYIAGETSIAKLDTSGRLVADFGDGGKLAMETLYPAILGIYGVSVDSLGDVYLTGSGVSGGEQVDFFVMELDRRGRPTPSGDRGITYLDFAGFADQGLASMPAEGGILLAGRVNGDAHRLNGDFGVAKVLVSPPPRGPHSSHMHR
jgi:uncharacterized delta-60 repeat protein